MTNTFLVSLYTHFSKEEKKPNWAWIVEEMDGVLETVKSQPSGIFTIIHNNDMYAVSFGHSFFAVEKYCDKDFGMEFAKRIELDEIKTTTLLSPNSRKNKTVNTFIDYNTLEFTGGESVAKLKAKCVNEQIEELFKPMLEMGSSIKFITKYESIENILAIVLFVEDILKKEIKRKIPMFERVKDKEKIKTLEESLKVNLESENLKINLSELDIIGATEIFYSNDFEYELSYYGKRKKIKSLDIQEVKEFVQENQFNYENLLKIRISGIKDGNTTYLGTIHNLIDYTDEDNKCLLNKGNWMMYNDDFMEYLHGSLREIECIYDPSWNMTNEIYGDFIKKMMKEHPGKTKEQLEKKYYREYVFNTLREKEGFDLYSI
ncbi:MAG: TIGR04141 family sporadically distributed protein [Bacillota bacterium]|nr:TIGR04141 family sporadically distributed protein [Bacillota bacterium]